jgi:HK97 family phage prohead protease
MDHLTLKAVATQTTDEGVFEAVISTESVDRERDVVVASAMVEALHSWTFTGKMIPLHWNHRSDPEDIVGHINPASVKEVNGEVVASGWIDQDIPRGRETWRLAKSDTLGFSFGYMVTDSVKRDDDIREIRKLDVFEISATPAPMNNETRVLSTKGVDERAHVRTEARQHMLDLFDGLVASHEDSLRKSCDDLAAELKAELQPVQVATFDC